MEFDVDNKIISRFEVICLEFSKEELYSLRMIVKEHLEELDEQIKNASGSDKNELKDYKIVVESILLKLYQ